VAVSCQWQAEGAHRYAWAAGCLAHLTLLMQAGAARTALRPCVPAAGLLEAGWPAAAAAAARMQRSRCCSAAETDPQPAAGQTAGAPPFRRRHWEEEGAPAAMAEGRTGAAPARAASRTEAPPAPRSAAVWAAPSRAARPRCRRAWRPDPWRAAASRAATRKAGTATPVSQPACECRHMCI